MTKLHGLMQFFTVLVWLSLVMTAIGCGSAKPTPDEKLNARFTRDEKIRYIYSRAVASFEQGKQSLNPKLLENARYDLTLLAHDFKHELSLAKLKEVDAFYAESISNYRELIKTAKSKQDTLLVASYYKRALTFAPDLSEAQEYLKKHERAIERLLQENLEKGNSALKAKEYARAQRYYTRVLNFDYDNADAQNGLAEATKQRRLLTLKNEILEREANSKGLSIVEKEQLYQAAKNAFEAKEYLKARELFVSIGDRKYKDVSDYLQRTVEKIAALNLEN